MPHADTELYIRCHPAYSAMFRMVKQASKKNSRTRRSGSGEEDSESLEVRLRVNQTPHHSCHETKLSDKDPVMP